MWVLFSTLRRDSNRENVVNRVRIAERQRKGTALDCCTVTDADHVQLTIESDVRAMNHIVNQGAGQTVKCRSIVRDLSSTGHDDLTVSTLAARRGEAYG